MIRINKLFHRPSSHFSLEVDSLCIETGAKVSIVGPSGSGKTTLIRLIAGLEPLVTGEITLFNTVISNAGQVPPHKRNIGLLSQDFGLWPHLTVAQHVAFARTHGNTLKKNVEDIRTLKMVNIDHKANALPSHLSGGERQRLALARSLANRPKILLLDEPFSNLDPVLADALLNILDEVHEAWGLTRIQVKHPHFGFNSKTERIIVMDSGRIVQDGRWNELLATPHNDWVKRLGEIIA